MNNNKSTVSLQYHIKLVDYYLSEGFVIIENNSSALSDVLLSAKTIIDAEILQDEYHLE